MKIEDIKIGDYYSCALGVRDYIGSNNELGQKIIDSRLDFVGVDHHGYNWSIKNFVVKVINIIEKHKVLIRICEENNKKAYKVHCSSIIRPASLKDIILKRKLY